MVIFRFTYKRNLQFYDISPCSFKVHLVTTRSPGSTRTSIETPTSLPWMSCSYLSKNNFYFTWFSIGNARQTDNAHCRPKFISCCLCESWIFRSVPYWWWRSPGCWCVWRSPQWLYRLPLFLKNTLVQIDVFYTYSLTIDYNIAKYSRCCVVYHILLIHETVLLLSEFHELNNTMSIVFILLNRFRQLLVKVKERGPRRELIIVYFLIVIVHMLLTEVACVIQLRVVEWYYISYILWTILPLSFGYTVSEPCSVPVISRYRMCFWAHCSRNRIYCYWTYREWRTRWRMASPSFHRCIQLDTNQILGIHGDSRNIIISILLNNNLAFIPCGGELYFHSFQFSLHEFALC